MKYRIGKKKKRALLNEQGIQVALFEPGQEDLAERVSKLLNPTPLSQSDRAERFFQLGASSIEYLKNGCIQVVFTTMDELSHVIMRIDDRGKLYKISIQSRGCIFVEEDENISPVYC